MVRDASIYLLDEPLTHVDAKIRFDLHPVSSPGRAATEHYRLCDARLCRGPVARRSYWNYRSGTHYQIGEPKQIYYHPRNIFVAHLVGQPSINLVNAQLDADNHGARLHMPQGGFAIPLGRTFRLQQANAPRELIVRIRPRDLTFTTAPETATARQSDVFEPFGSFGLLSVLAQDIYLKLLIDPEQEVTPRFPWD